MHEPRWEAKVLVKNEGTVGGHEVVQLVSLDDVRRDESERREQATDLVFLFFVGLEN